MTLSRLSLGFSVLSILGVVSFGCSDHGKDKSADVAVPAQKPGVETLDTVMGHSGPAIRPLKDPSDAAPPPTTVSALHEDVLAPGGDADAEEPSFGLTAAGKKSSRYDFNGDGISDLVSKSMETGALTVHFVKKTQDPVFKGYFDKVRESERKSRGFASGTALCDALYGYKLGSVQRSVFRTINGVLPFKGVDSHLEAACKANPTSLGVFESKVITGALAGRYAKLVGSADMDGNGVSDLVYRQWGSGAMFVILVARNAAGDLSQIRRVNLPTVGDNKWMVVGIGSGPNANFNYIYFHHIGDAALTQAAQAPIAGTLAVWKLPRSYFAVATEGQGYAGYHITRVTNFGWWPVAVEDFNSDGTDDILWSRFYHNAEPITSKCSHLQPVCAKQGLLLSLYDLNFNADGTFLFTNGNAVKSSKTIDMSYAPLWDYAGATSDAQMYPAYLNSTKSWIQASGAYYGRRPRISTTSVKLGTEAQYPNWLVDMYGYDRNNYGGAQKVWGDFNGDGRPDIAYLSVTPKTGKLNASVYASAGPAISQPQDGNYVARVSATDFYNNMKDPAIQINLPAYNSLVASGMNFKSNYEAQLLRNEPMMGEVSTLNQGVLGENGSFRPGKPIAGLKVLVGGLAPGWWPNAAPTLAVDIPSTVWDMW